MHKVTVCLVEYERERPNRLSANSTGFVHSISYYNFFNLIYSIFLQALAKILLFIISCKVFNPFCEIFHYF